MGLKSKIVGWTLAGSIALAAPVVTYYEGYDAEVYLDPVGIPTVCYGHVTESQVGEVFTKEACEDFLKSDLEIAANGVEQVVIVDIPDHSKAAFISFVYNVGLNKFKRSTMLKLINQGRLAEACHELPKWVYAKGKKLPGLVKRRQAEMQLCLGNV